MRVVARATWMVVLLLVAVSAPAANAAAPSAYDLFDAQTLTSGDAPLVTGAVTELITPEFDNSNDTLQAGETTNPVAAPACAEDANPNDNHWGAKTAWVRFNPGVAGNITARSITPTYDSIVWVRETTGKPGFGSATFSDLGRADCSDSISGAGDEGIGTVMHATPDHAYYLEVAARCGTKSASPCSPADEAAATGGSTRIRVTFTPDDSDQDGVPDTNDACPGTPGGTPVTGDGCSDTDRDGIRDDQEGPGCVGRPGVPQAFPYNGCPPGPAPPFPNSPPEVVITSLDGNPQNTNSTAVILQLNWRQGEQEALVSNGEVIGDAKRIPLAPQVNWTLAPALKSETRQVKVTFLGPGGLEDARDDIITLDVVKPTVRRYLLIDDETRSQGVRPAASAGWYLGLDLTDDKSGVRRVEVLDARRRTLASRDLCGRAAQCPLKVLRPLVGRGRPKYLRTRDDAGNVRTKALAHSRVKCYVMVPVAGRRYGYDCFRPGQSCRTIRRRYVWAASAPIRLSCNRRGRITRR
jgi:hypothetical protein